MHFFFYKLNSSINRFKKKTKRGNSFALSVRARHCGVVCGVKGGVVGIVFPGWFQVSPRVEVYVVRI